MTLSRNALQFLRFCVLCLIATLVAGSLGLAQPVQALAPLMADMWVTNGTVYATLLSGSTLYIGGDFTQVGPTIGGFAVLDAAGTANRAFPPVNGMVYAIVSDGDGGWYIGGSFTHVGGHPRNNLAHIKADKSLDFAWNPTTNSMVRALAVAGSTLYVGGGFTNINGQYRGRIAALDIDTGLVTSWSPNANNVVYALVANSNTIYAGGNFGSIGGQIRSSIAALNAGTGLATEWNPNANRAVFALAMDHSGDTLYVGGNFAKIGEQSRNSIAALNTNTGLATSWNPNASSDVWALVMDDSDSTLYVGGRFTSIGGQPRNRIAALDTGTGSATAWNPDASESVYTLALSGSTIYVGGDFTWIGGQPRNRIGELELNTGLATEWNPNASYTVYVLAVAPIAGGDGRTISAGGSFVSIGGQARHNIAALDTSTGTVTDWNPTADYTVYALALSDNTIYAGGQFTSIGGQTRIRIAALDAGTGLATEWNPNADSTVMTLGVYDNTIYAAGSFRTIGGQIRNRIAALDASTGLATEWNPNANNVIWSLVVVPPISAGSSSTIYAGGEFTSIGGQSRNRIAALDANTGLATTWNPNANGSVGTLAVAPDSTIYVGGGFSVIGGQTRNRIAALDASTGLATDWVSNIGGYVYTLAVHDNMIYVGGDFSTVNGQIRNRIAALEAIMGKVTAWNPNATGNIVYTLAVGGNTVYAGGDFLGIAGRPSSHIAALRDGTATCQSVDSGGSWQVSHWSACGNAVPGDGDSLIIQSGHTLTLYGSLAANDLTTRAGGTLELPLGSGLMVEGTVTHSGRLTQTLAVPGSATTTFLNLKNAAGTTDKFFGAALTPVGDMGYTRVSIYGNQPCTSAPGDALIKRCFNIAPTTSQNATMRLYYTNAEINAQVYNDLKLWHWGPGWSQVGDNYTYSTTCDFEAQDCWMEAQNVSSYSPFGLGSGSQPTVVHMQSFAARAIPAEGGVALLGLLLLDLCGVGLARRRR